MHSINRICQASFCPFARWWHGQSTVEPGSRWEPAGIWFGVPIGVGNRENTMLGQPKHLHKPADILPINSLTQTGNGWETINKLGGKLPRCVFP